MTPYDGGTTAIYLRISKDDDNNGDSESIVNQRNILLEYIKSHEDLRYTQIVEVVDDGCSGANFNRPGVTRLLDLARKRQIQNIIVKDFSRFGRSYFQVGDYLEQIFPFLGIRFISVSDNYDSIRPECGAGNINVAFKHILHSYYVKDLSQKVRTSIRIRMEQGDFRSMYAIFGYKKSGDKHKLEIDEPAADIVRRLFALITEGFSTTQTAKILNSEGIPTPSLYKQMTGCTRNWNLITDKNHWTESIVYQIATDIRYTGCVVGGKRICIEPGSHKMKRQPKEKWYIRENMHEAVITPYDFGKVRECIKKRNADYSKLKKSTGVFSRKLICATCGHALKLTDSRSIAYLCQYSQTSKDGSCFPRPINKSELETAVTAALQAQMNILIEEERLAERCRHRKTDLAAINAQIRLFNKQMDKLISGKRAVYEKFTDELMSKEDYLNQRSECESQIASITYKLHELEQTKKDAEKPVENLMLKSLMAVKTEDGPLNKQVFDALVEKILVYDANRIEIVWKVCNQMETAR